MNPISYALLATRILLAEDASMIMEDRLEFLKQHYQDKLNTGHDPNAEHKITQHPSMGSPEKRQQEVHKVVDFWAQHDPTPTSSTQAESSIGITKAAFDRKTTHE